MVHSKNVSEQEVTSLVGQISRGVSAHLHQIWVRDYGGVSYIPTHCPLPPAPTPPPPDQTAMEEVC